MKDTTAAVGTSPEVLQHYLTAGIEVYHKPTKQRHELGLSDLRPNVLFIDDMFIWDYVDCLPVLRSFSQLCDPLPDGTVPAVEVAKLLIGGEDDEYTYEVSAHECGGGFTVLGSIEGELVYQLDLRQNWDWWLSDLLATANHEEITVKNPAAVIDYLRSKHFALPVNGRPLVEGVDYIAKEPATPKSGGAPTMQEGAIDS